MKRNRTIAIAVLLLASVAMLPGCGVWMNAQYSNALDKNVAWSEQAAALAESGQLSETQKTQSLRDNATLWKKFQDARDGKADDKTATTQTTSE